MINPKILDKLINTPEDELKMILVEYDRMKKHKSAKYKNMLGLASALGLKKSEASTLISCLILGGDELPELIEVLKKGHVKPVDWRIAKILQTKTRSELLEIDQKCEFVKYDKRMGGGTLVWDPELGRRRRYNGPTLKQLARSLNLTETGLEMLMLEIWFGWEEIPNRIKKLEKIDEHGD